MIIDLVGEQPSAQIASPASTEEPETYLNNVDFYREKNYRYIPIPSVGEYYDILREQMEEMSDSQILPYDVHLIIVIARLREHPFILLDNYGLLADQSDLVETFGLVRDHEDRYGIVTVADLNKRRVREMLYPAIAAFEHTLADLVAEHYPESDVPENHVRQETFDRWDQAKEQDIETHIVEHMSLGDIVTVIGNTEPLRNRCGFDSKTQFSDAVGGLVDLRNKVMHPRRTLVPDISHVDKTIQRLGRITTLIKTIETGSGH